MYSTNCCLFTFSYDKMSYTAHMCLGNYMYVHSSYQLSHTLTHLQADVNGLRWIRYLGPNSTSLEAPKDDPVLNSYARLLNEG